MKLELQVLSVIILIRSNPSHSSLSSFPFGTCDKPLLPKILQNVPSRCKITVIFFAPSMISETLNFETGFYTPLELITHSSIEEEVDDIRETLKHRYWIQKHYCAFYLIYFNLPSEYQLGAPYTKYRKPGSQFTNNYASSNFLSSWITGYVSGITNSIKQDPQVTYALVLTVFCRSSFPNHTEPVGISGTYLHNIGLLFLPHPLDETEKFQTICIQHQGEEMTLEHMTCDNKNLETFDLLDSFHKLSKPSPRVNIMLPNAERYKEASYFLNKRFKTYESHFYSKSSIIASELVRITNMTPIYGLFLEGNIPNMGYSNEYPDNGMYGKIVVTHSTTINFLTCHVKPVLSFELYIAPFQTEVWIVTIANSVIIIAILYVHNTAKCANTYFSNVLFFCGATLTQAYPIPECLWKSTFLRVLMGTWLLVVVNFTSCYNSLVIAELNNPLQGRKYMYFDDILCPYKRIPNFDTFCLLPKYSKDSNCYPASISLTALSKHSFEVHKISTSNLAFVNYIQKQFASYQSPQCFSLLNKPSSTLSEDHDLKLLSDPVGYDLIQGFVRRSLLFIQLELGKVKLFNASYIIENLGRLSKFLNLAHRHYPLKSELYYEEIFSKLTRRQYAEAEIENELIKCGRSAYVGHREDVLSRRSYLEVNYPNMKFYLGNDSLLSPQPTVWDFGNVGTSKLDVYLMKFVEAGIHSFVHNFIMSQEIAQRLKGTRLLNKNIGGPKALTTDGSIQTIFIIWSGMIIVSLLAFIIHDLVSFSSLSFRLRQKLRWLMVVCLKLLYVSYKMFRKFWISE